jgi:hypothetical protein
MTLRYADIESLLAAGKTPAEIAALLAVRTVKPLAVADLEHYLFVQKIANRHPVTSAWQGPLINAMQNESFPTELREGIEELMSFVNNRSSVSIDTTQEPRASQTASLLPALLATGVLTETQAGEILALAGGHKFPGIDEAAVQAAIDAEQLRVVKKQLEDSAVDALQAFREALAAWDGSGDAPVLGGG